jgi:hypothetical protein
VYKTLPTTSILFKLLFLCTQLFQSKKLLYEKLTTSKFGLSTQANCKIKLKDIIKLTGIQDQILDLKEEVFIFNIITTNKKSTAMAPT